MGTTLPDPPMEAGGKLLFWKLQAEAFLSTSGLRSVIVKPCGLSTGPGYNSTLITGHNDELLALDPDQKFRTIDRQDVVRVLIAALADQRASLRFDLCAQPGKPTKDEDLPSLLNGARWPWDRL
eukprot:TRINITY_DN4245_c0_g1_i1.p1 TRINITY_DN4245_c0_g1~~TRINITY_DN4245_c0_g1_i1.p1  ORF type:complete len:124 (-),score=5.84 TRINITY_DN4245_c0_g1_i1:140-511(-)